MIKCVWVRLGRMKCRFLRLRFHAAVHVAYTVGANTDANIDLFSQTRNPNGHTGKYCATLCRAQCKQTIGLLSFSRPQPASAGRLTRRSGAFGGRCMYVVVGSRCIRQRCKHGPWFLLNSDDERTSLGPVFRLEWAIYVIVPFPRKNCRKDGSRIVEVFGTVTECLMRVWVG